MHLLFGKILSKTLLSAPVNGCFLSYMWDLKDVADCTYGSWLQRCEEPMWRRTSGGPTRIWPAAQLATWDAGKPRKAGGRDNTTKDPGDEELDDRIGLIHAYGRD
jgi:hypothetical protein